MVRIYRGSIIASSGLIHVGRGLMADEDNDYHQ
jgi:hypothetical protein